MTIRRRDFITLLGGAAAWPVAASAQQAERMRRIGVLQSLAADDPEGLTRVTAFAQGLQELGWTVGRNVRIDYRWGMADPDRYRKYAAELVALAPDVLLAVNTSTVRALQQATRTIPIVFAGATDPIGGGLVASLNRPGGNVTGFTGFDFGTAGKWLELLKEMTPRMTRAAVLRDPTTTGGTGQFGAIQAVAPALGVEVSAIDLHDAGDIEREIAAFAGRPNGGLIVISTSLASLHRQLIIMMAARHQLPAAYPYRYFVTDGGLLSYGPDEVDPFRRAAGYVDRVLKGEKPADLPVQAPTKFETVINLKTAKALGLTVPPSLLAIADEVIE